MGTIAHTTRAFGLRMYAEPQLVEHALGGDALAFSELYRRYQPRVYGFCLARLLSPDAAQDACQEVFVRLLAADGGSVRSVGPWLFGTARHVCVDVARHDSRVDLGDGELDGAEAGQPAIAAEAEALSRADARRVLVALRRVRPRYRTALVMREIHGLPMRDIAEALGVGEGAAYTVLSRARDAFGKAYAEILDLPNACAEAVEMMYRKSGSGISVAENACLEQHLDTCDACRRESLRADDRSRLAALLPLLPAASSKGLITRAMAAFGAQAPSLQTAATYVPFTQTVMARTGVMLLLTGSLVAAAGYSGSMAISRARLATYGSEEPSPGVDRTSGGSSARDDEFVPAGERMQRRDVADPYARVGPGGEAGSQSGMVIRSGEDPRAGVGSTGPDTTSRGQTGGQTDAGTGGGTPGSGTPGSSTGGSGDTGGSGSGGGGGSGQSGGSSVQTTEQSGTAGGTLRGQLLGK